MAPSGLRISCAMLALAARAPQAWPCWMLGDQRRVLEEEHDAAVAAAAQRREVRLNVRAVRRAERQSSIDVAAAAPTAQLRRELRRHRREIRLAVAG
jgi:hypothetical protein